jgi:hypothetical protein
MKTLERHLLQAVTNYLRNLQRQDSTLVWRKRHGSIFSTTGDPDIYGVWTGIPFEIELKRQGSHTTPLQSARLTEWTNAGALTAVAHSLTEFHDALMQIKLATFHR